MALDPVDTQFSGCMMPAVASPGHQSESKQVLEAQLRATLEVIPAYTWYADSSGALTFVNKRHADYLGLPNDHPLRFGVATGAAWDSHIPFVHPDDQEEARRVWSTCVRTGCAGEFTFRVRNAEGVYRWFITRAEPLRASDGTLLYWIGVNLEIDELKQAQFYLSEGQRLAHMGSWAFNPTGFEHWSSELFRVYGLDPSGKPPTVEEYLDLVHPEDREFVMHEIQKMLASNTAFEFTKRIVRRDGEIRHVRCVGIPTNSAGAAQRFVGTGLDVTEQEQLMEALRDKERELRQILDLAPQHVAVFGPGRERLYANRMLLSYLGRTLEQWRHTSPDRDEFVHPDDFERVIAHFDRAVPGGAGFEFELRLRKGDGSYRWFLARCNPVRDDKGQITRWYVASTDIEDRKRGEQRLQHENVALREEIDKASMFEEIVGTSPALKSVLSRVSKVAPSDSTVLITGETGTGKELVARAIHRRSDRASGAFVSVNCAAIPRDLIASELFGHEKGAFTGATQQRLGRFELANGGTIFLDEVGDLPAETQVALLRVLQEHEFERVGGTRPIRADVRVIAATNRDLRSAIQTGSFRSDLFYRLHVFPIEIPPLRERGKDIPLLVEYFIDRYARKAGKRITTVDKKTLRLFESYPWPGNIRELQNVIERSVIVCETATFSVDESWLSHQSPERKAESQLDFPEKVAAQEKEIIEAALRECQGRVFGPSGAAARLGIARSTLESKIRSLRIDKARFKA
jgi:PAS domain S-box-containing protein